MKIKIYDSREECLVAGAWAFICLLYTSDAADE